MRIYYSFLTVWIFFLFYFWEIDQRSIPEMFIARRWSPAQEPLIYLIKEFLTYCWKKNLNVIIIQSVSIIHSHDHRVRIDRCAGSEILTLFNLIGMYMTSTVCRLPFPTIWFPSQRERNVREERDRERSELMKILTQLL